jgi:WD40 repeat protein
VAMFWCIDSTLNKPWLRWLLVDNDKQSRRSRYSHHMSAILLVRLALMLTQWPL